MKKIFNIFLILCVIMSLFSFNSVYANQINYFNTDFENDTVGEVPSALLGHSSTFNTSAAEVFQDETDNKYIQVKQRVRALFNESVADGTIVVEFDANLGLGSLGLGVLYDNSLTTYAKWIFGWTRQQTGDGTIVSYTGTGAVPPGSHDSRVDVKNAESGEALVFKVNAWQHYKVWIDLDNSAVKMNISDDENPSGLTSEFVTDISYIGGSNRPLAAIAFYNGRPAGVTDPLLVDNIKVYREENDLVDYEFKSYTEEISDGSGVVPSMLEKATLSFTNPVDETTLDSSITLYNNTSASDEEILITYSANKREVYIAPAKKYLDPNSSYTLTIGDTVLDKYNQPLKEAKTISFTTDEGGFEVSEINILKGEAVADTILPGDEITLQIIYYRTGDAVANPAIVAYCAKNLSILCDVQCDKVVFDGVGKCEYKKNITIPSDLVFDKINVHLWDEATRVPVISGVSFGG